VGTRVRAFDGLRGLAVVAVLLFHAEVAGARGGFLGVSAFFTLSGFLITTLLLAEHRRHRGIGLGRFWSARARRLLPAALVALTGILVFGATAATTDQVRDLRSDVLAALGYVANWRFIADSRAYDEIFAAPSPVLHFWSLAIEEQFYVVFPVLLVAALAIFRGRLAPLAAILVGGTAASIAMAHLNASDTTRVYYGTDTRAAELLIGALLAILLVRWNGPARRSGRIALGGAGVLALGLMLFWWSTVDRGDSWLYHGGFALHAVLTAIVIAAACAPTAVAGGLAFAPLVALGRISYGAYLYHWPIYLWLSSDRVGTDGAALLGLRLTVTLVCATASFFLIEEPIRTGHAVFRSWRRVFAPAAVAAVIVAALAVTATPPPPEFVLAPVNSAGAERTARTTPAASTREIPPETTSTAVTSTSTALPPTPAPAFARARAPGEPLRILVVGDSVGLTLGRGLELSAADTGLAVVRNDARKWCALGRDLPRIAGIGVDRQAGDCNNWATRWSGVVDRFDPHSVVVLSTIWEVAQRELPGAAAFTVPGDPAHDAWQRSEYEVAADVLGRRGATVTWLTIPCQPDLSSARGTPTWVVNERIIADVARSRPFVRVLDLDAQLCPGHRFRGTYAGVDPARPDGRHFSDDGARAVADWIMPILSGDAAPPEAVATRVDRK
jgi:peptidoglycan/LPS O-acetylase OafA/YrhL